MKVNLEIMQPTEYLDHTNTQDVLSCYPFVENSRGKLIHRPRKARYIPSYLDGTMLVVEYWCKASASGTKELTFLPLPPDGKYVCAICEARATMAGQPESDAVSGKHVHKGRVKAVRTCCNG